MTMYTHRDKPPPFEAVWLNDELDKAGVYQIMNQEIQNHIGEDAFDKKIEELYSRLKGNVIHNNRDLRG